MPHAIAVRCRTAIAALAFGLVACAAARAEVRVTYPLDGYFHPGRYMPLRVAVTDKPPGPELMLGGSDGAASTRWDLRGSAGEAVLPWLPLERTARLSWWLNGVSPATPIDRPLRPLEENQRLVGWVSPDAGFARSLFPGNEVVSVALDATDPLPGSAAAWNTLDAVLLDGPALRKLDEQRLAGLLACGVLVAARADEPPWPAWPWKRSGGYWVLSLPLAGPRDARYNPAAYQPIAGWHPGLPPGRRRQTLLAAIVFSVAILGLVLWRPRHVALWAVLLSGAVASGFGYWATWQPPVEQRGGDVLVLNDGFAQADEWVYQKTSYHDIGEQPVRWMDVCWPVLSETPAFDNRIQVRCLANGDPDVLSYRLRPDRPMAILARTVGPRSPQYDAAAPAGRASLMVAAPLGALLREQYLARGETVAGRATMVPHLSSAYLTAAQWPTLVLDRRGGQR